MTSPEPIRPRDLALLLLASRDLRPRVRARDQQADLAGLHLKKKVLQELADRDPEPDLLESALEEIAERLDGPAGPARATALAVLEDWRAACLTSAWVAQLLEEAVQEKDPS